jgi:hypothetical protein
MIVMVSNREHVFAFDQEEDLNKVHKQLMDALKTDDNEWIHIANVDIRLDCIESVAKFKDGEMMPDEIKDEGIGYG